MTKHAQFIDYVISFTIVNPEDPLEEKEEEKKNCIFTGFLRMSLKNNEEGADFMQITFQKASLIALLPRPVGLPFGLMARATLFVWRLVCVKILF
jgi:hypothetical protein